MERRLGEWCDLLLKNLEQANYTDFAQLALAVVITGWFAIRLRANGP